MPLAIREHIPLAPFTSFQVGGPARYFCAPKSAEGFKEALAFVRDRQLPFFVLGKGTNLVFSDAGFSGLVIYTGEFDGISWEGDMVTAQCGALLLDVVTQSVERGFIGMQNLAGIPGTMGGGTYINAGAFEQELKDVIHEVVSLRTDGNETRRDNAACGFAYRRSNFIDSGELILESTMRVRSGGSVRSLRAEMEAILAKRAEKQPLHLPNAGSMFKRPPGQYAGALIQAAGLKGFRMGNAGISDQHANFTVNLGGATAQEIWDLTREVICRVKDHSGVTLEREVIFVGGFLPWPR